MTSISNLKITCYTQAQEFLANRKKRNVGPGLRLQLEQDGSIQAVTQKEVILITYRPGTIQIHWPDETGRTETSDRWWRNAVGMGPIMVASRLTHLTPWRWRVIYGRFYCNHNFAGYFVGNHHTIDEVTFKVKERPTNAPIRNQPTPVYSTI